MITEFGIDGFRVDTVKHVNDELWEAFVPAIQAHAASEGIADFFIFGEVFSGDAAFASRFTTELPFPSLLDFGFDGAATNFAGPQPGHRPACATFSRRTTTIPTMTATPTRS